MRSCYLCQCYEKCQINKCLTVCPSMNEIKPCLINPCPTVSECQNAASLKTSHFVKNNQIGVVSFKMTIDICLEKVKLQFGCRDILYLAEFSSYRL